MIKIRDESVRWLHLIMKERKEMKERKPTKTTIAEGRVMGQVKKKVRRKKLVFQQRQIELKTAQSRAKKKKDEKKVKIHESHGRRANFTPFSSATISTL